MGCGCVAGRVKSSNGGESSWRNCEKFLFFRSSRLGDMRGGTKNGAQNDGPATNARSVGSKGHVLDAVDAQPIHSHSFEL